MSKELLNILANSNKDIDNQKLMDYLSGKLYAEERHEMEKQMVDSDLVNDAVEGLQDFKNKKDITTFVDQLNSDLHKQLEKKKLRKQKHRLKEQPWLYLAIILILLIIIICFIVIKNHLDSEKQQKKNLPAKTSQII